MIRVRKQTVKYSIFCCDVIMLCCCYDISCEGCRLMIVTLNAKILADAVMKYIRNMSVATLQL